MAKVLRIASALFAVALLGLGGASAQDAPANAGSAPAGQQQAQENWVSRCVAPARNAPLECAIEQRLIMQNTQQLVALVSIRTPSESGAAMLALQAPLGLFLPAGIGIDVDGASAQVLELQTCDNNGCYANTPISEDLLAAMTRGQKLNIKFQNLNKQRITISATLLGFTAALQRIR